MRKTWGRYKDKLEATKLYITCNKTDNGTRFIVRKYFQFTTCYTEIQDVKYFIRVNEKLNNTTHEAFQTKMCFSIRI
jgi:hypothetical protein